MISLECIKPAIQDGSVSDVLPAIVCRNGWLYTKSVETEAGHPCDLPDFIVPAVKFVNAVSVTPEAEIKVSKSSVTVKNSTKSIRIGQLAADDYETVSHPSTMDNKTVNACECEKVDKNLIRSFGVMSKFRGEDNSRPWTSSILEKEGHFYTTNDRVMVRTARPFETCFSGISLPKDFVDYLVKHSVTHWGMERDSFFAWTATGGFIKAARLLEQTPGMVPDAFDSQYAEPEWEITEQWKEVFGDTSRSMLNVVTILPEKMESEGENGGYKVTAHIDTPIESEENKAAFTVKDLTGVIAIADRIDFSSWPRPVSFDSGHVKGIIAGMRV